LPNTFRNYKCPFLIIAAGMDKLIDPDVGKELMERVYEIYIINSPLVWIKT